MGFLGELARNFMLRNSLRRQEGARFSTKNEMKSFLSSGNKGLLIDGYESRLSEAQSFQGSCVIAGVGVGKTSGFVIPNIFDLASRKCSIIVNDPKGEIHDATAGYLIAKGFNVISLEPENLSLSDCFNPLWEAQNERELEQIAEILVRAGASKSDNDIWNKGAIRLVSILLKLLKIAGDEKPSYNTLGNLYYLLQNFGDRGSGLDDFVYRYGRHEKRYLTEWEGVISGNKEGVNSFVLTALTALSALSNPDLDLMTSKSTFSLQDIRFKKTAIFFKTPPQYMEYYGFITSIFFRSVFNSCMRTMPTARHLSVYCIYDEFGHSTIPNFVSTINTIRGYRVSVSIILQSLGQLTDRYGADYARSIQGGIKTYITFSASDPQTRAFFEELSGKTVLWDKKSLQDMKEYRQEYNLMSAGDLRTLPAHQIFVISGNMHPMILNFVPYFANQRMVRKLKVGLPKIVLKDRPYETFRVPLD